MYRHQYKQTLMANHNLGRGTGKQVDADRQSSTDLKRYYVTRLSSARTSPHNTERHTAVGLTARKRIGTDTSSGELHTCTISSRAALSTSCCSSSERRAHVRSSYPLLVSSRSSALLLAALCMVVSSSATCKQQGDRVDYNTVDAHKMGMWSHLKSGSTLHVHSSVPLDNIKTALRIRALMQLAV